MRTIALIRADFMKQWHTPYFSYSFSDSRNGGDPVCVLLLVLSKCG